MNFKRVSLIAALPTALLFAGLAFGQTTPPQTPPQPMPASTAQYPQATPQQDPQSSANSMNNSMSNSMGNFQTLAGSKGYVTKTEAANDPWLSSHFRQCDSNRDSKVNRSEYEACHHMEGQAMQPQSSGG